MLTRADAFRFGLREKKVTGMRRRKCGPGRSYPGHTRHQPES
jgi:hypothetical protein